MDRAVRFGLLLAICGVAAGAHRAARAACDADNGGITLPQGFCATVFADLIGSARHLVITPNGTAFVLTRAAASR
jgi:hypothetical protein